VVCGFHGEGGGDDVNGGAWWSEWVMGTTKFDATWWVKGHETFGAHEAGGLLWTRAPFFKNCLPLQNNPKFIKLIT
jgi:hypothetical protein